MSVTTTQLLFSGEFANCVMTLYLLKLHLQTFLSTPITQKCQISSCDSIVLGVRYVRVTVYSKPHKNYTVIRRIIYVEVLIFNALCPAVQKLSDLIRRKYFRYVKITMDAVHSFQRS